jgi:hypothetical protein
MGCFLHLDELSIFGTLTGDLLQPCKHILTHMGHDESFWLKLVQMSYQGVKIQVKLDFLFEKVRLCNQEIGSSGCWHKGLRPFRITRIGDDFPVALHAQGEGRFSSRMLNAVSGDDYSCTGYSVYPF